MTRKTKAKSSAKAGVKPQVAAKSNAKALSKKKTARKLPLNYRPLNSESFMNKKQQTYFREKLVAWKEDILRSNRVTLQNLQDESEKHADIADRATDEADRALELRARDRQRKLISKIDAALLRIDDGTYGYCEETGEPIGLRRLDARPVATLSLEAQEQHERRERVYRTNSS
jgi:DnaK suppressor protein